MSDFFVSWHMIVREDDDNFRQVLDSIQGLYDELIVGVDSRPESDNVYELAQSYPNVTAFRQEWPGRFDTARNDVLSRINPKADYVGCCDSDEVLSTPSPLEVRQWLQENQPKAVNVGIRYLHDVGPNFKDSCYLRTKIWNTKYPRLWGGKIHEYPSCQKEYNCPTPAPHIIFDHLKVDHKSYRTELIITTMLKEISEGNVRWYPYLAQEYRAINDYDNAINCCLLYIERKDAEDLHIKSALEECLYIITLITSEKWSYFLNKILPLIQKYSYLENNAILCEYIAMAYFYLDQKNVGKMWHNRAFSLFDEASSCQHFIRYNNQFYV